MVHYINKTDPSTILNLYYERRLCMKRQLNTFYQTLLSIFCILLSGILLYAIFLYRNLHVTYEPAVLTTSTQKIQNPYCGFYHLRGYMLSEEPSYDATEWAEQACNETSCSLLLLEINLKNYAGSALSNHAIEQVNQILDVCSASKKQVLLRFLYDWDGKAMEAEPEMLYQIKDHMSQISGVVNAHKDCVYVLQSLFIGNCGEMNNSRFATPEQIKELATHLANVTDNSIYLAVRTPAHLRNIVSTFIPLTDREAYNGTLISRLGLFNDGMLGSVYDLGTYDDTVLTNTSALTEQGTREEEIRFQNALCQYVPNGGEVVIDNHFNDINNAVQDLADMHVSYLNKDYDTAVFDKWKESSYYEDPDFPNANGYDYIEMHLGYRYALKTSSLQFHSFASDEATLYITITNQGFAPAYRKFDTTITLTNTETDETIILETDFDNRKIAGSDDYTFRLNLDVRSLAKGTYTMTLSMKDPALQLPIYFANEGLETQTSIPLGTITLE